MSPETVLDGERARGGSFNVDGPKTENSTMGCRSRV